MLKKFFCTFTLIFAALTSAMAEPATSQTEIADTTKVVYVGHQIIMVKAMDTGYSISAFCENGEEVTIHINLQNLNPVDQRCLALPATLTDLVQEAFSEA